MVQIVGKYQHQSEEGLEEFMVALGTPADKAKVSADDKPIVEFKEAGGSWTVITIAGGKESSTTFKLGEAYDDAMANGAAFKSVTVREGDKLTTTSDLPDGNQFIRVYEFNDAGFVMILTDKKSGKSAKFTDKRI